VRAAIPSRRQFRTTEPDAFNLMLPSTPFSAGDIVAAAVLVTLVVPLAVVTCRRSAESRIIVAALATKLTACFAYAGIVVFFYGFGDTLWYHEAGSERADVLRQDLVYGSTDYITRDPFYSLQGDSTTRMESLSGLVHFLFWDSFLASSVFFALAGFAGQLLLYRTFVVRYPDPRLRNWWRLAILFFPSLTFWSAGILKDSLGICGLGCTFWAVHRLLQKPSAGSALAGLAGAYVLYLYRPQVLPVLFIALMPWLLIESRRVPTPGHNEGPVLFRWIMPTLLGCLCLAVLTVTLQSDSGLSVAELPDRLEQDRTAYEQIEAGSTLEAPVSFEASWGGILRAWPVALFVTMFRPFLWETSGSVLQLFAALENLFFALLSLRAAFVVLLHPRVGWRALQSPMFLTCVIFVALFGCAVGIATPNLGTLSRYRIPLIPFYMAALIILESCRPRQSSGVRRILESPVFFRVGAGVRRAVAGL
jgi:hypothetical protein